MYGITKWVARVDRFPRGPRKVVPEHGAHILLKLKSENPTGSNGGRVEVSLPANFAGGGRIIRIEVSNLDQLFLCP